MRVDSTDNVLQVNVPLGRVSLTWPVRVACVDAENEKTKDTKSLTSRQHKNRLKRPIKFQSRGRRIYGRYAVGYKIFHANWLIKKRLPVILHLRRWAKIQLNESQTRASDLSYTTKSNWADGIKRPRTD